MNNHPSARLADIIEGDEQGQLVLKIQALAYKINQASFADVFVDQAPTTLRVRVVEYFKNDPSINDRAKPRWPRNCRRNKCAADVPPAPNDH